MYLNLAPFFLFFALCGQPLFSQNCNLCNSAACGQIVSDFSYLDGTNEVCDGASKLVVNNSDTTDISFAVWCWGDGSSNDTVYSNFYQPLSHTFNIPDNLVCNASVTTQPVQLTLFRTCGTSSFSCHFTQKGLSVIHRPKADFGVTTVVCVGDEICLTENGCNADTYTLQIQPGNITYNTPIPCHTFTSAGTYTLTRTVTNQCATATATQQIQVLELPVSNPVVIQGVKEILADTLVVCIGDTLCLNGDSLSLHETSWRWDFLTNINNNCFDYDPPPTSNPQDVSLLPRPKLVFFCDGIYRLELRVNNPCNAPDTKVLIFKVVRPPIVAFSLNVSDCTPTITVNPANSLQVTASQLTECLWDFGPQGTSTLCDPGAVTFSASTPVTFTGWNQCDTVTLTGQVTLTASGQALITSPCPDTLCTDDAPCTLAANLPGGSWTNNGSPATAIFNPATANIGLNTIAYGAPPCITPAQVQIFVINSAVNINGPTTLCMDAGPTAYSATPAGGSFSSSKNAIDPATGLYNPAAAGPGTDTIFYQTPGNSFCQGSAFLVVQVVQLSVGIQVTDCNGLSISFATTAGTSPFTGITWNFGNGQTGAQATPTHTYATAGTYTVSATITASGCTASATLPVSIVEPPSANFTLIYPSPACGPLTVTANDLSTGDDLTYLWNIGGTAVSGADPGPISLNNTALISLTVSNDCGSSTHSETVPVEPSPIALFGANQFVCSGDTLDIFNNASFYNSLSWDFGNGQTSSDTGALQQVAYFTGDDNDTITITLIAFGICPPDTFTQQVIVVPTDAQAFVTTTAAPLFQVCQNEQVCFESFSLPSGVPLLWDFGDGNTTIGFGVCHTWDEPGVYEVVSKLVSCGFDSTITTITVLPIPEAAFVPPSTGCPGESLFFENTSSGAISYLWKFGDGDFSMIVSPNHVFDSAGIYEVCLIVLSANGCRDTVFQNVEISAPPTASFTFDNPGCQGDNVVFTNTSPNVVSCSWDFDNGNFSAVCNPVAVFNLPGAYNVALTVTNADGCPATASQIVLVGALPLPAFTFQMQDTCHPVTVVFTNNSQLADGYLWQFGNGDTSTATNPQHVYDSPGTYTVTLTTIADGVCTAAISQNLTIEETPVASISQAQNERCFGEAFPFQSNSSGSISNLEWDFGDGLFSFEANPAHTYTGTGSFQVVLTVFNGNVCKDSDTLQVTVHPPVLATADITDVPCFGDASGEINISLGSGTPVFSFDWSNGATTEDISNLPAGNHTLLITDANGCNWDSAMTVQQPPALELTQVSEQIVTCAGGSDGGLCVQAGGGVGGYLLVWENGVTGDCISDMAAGLYGVSLTDANGCLLAEEFEVRENPPIAITDSVMHRPCFGADVAFIRIDAVTGGAGGYSLSLEGADDFLEMGYNFGRLQPGAYHLTVTDMLGCITEKSYVITEPDSIWLDVIDDTIGLKLGADTVLFIDHNLGTPTFIWSPPTGLDCPTCPEPLTRPFDDVTYLLTMTDAIGCTVTDRVTVLVEKDRTIFIPNTFTPNADGRNDVFRIRVGVKSIEQVEVFQVTDRWGEVVFEARNFDPISLDPADAWDGKFRGEPLPPDNYYYVAQIRYVDGVEKLFEGSITLIR